MHRFETHFADAQLPGDVLELAGRALRTGRALLVVVGQQQLDGYLTNLADLFRLRAHLQARFGGSRAGALDAAALDVHQAEAASPIHAQVRVIAERRQVDARFSNQLQQIALAVERHFAPVNGQCLCSYGGSHVAFKWFRFSRFHALVAAGYTPRTASNLQTSAQTPHLMHSAWSIVWACFRSPLMACTGHFLAHAVQPLHLAGSMLGLASALHWPLGQCL